MRQSQRYIEIRDSDGVVMAGPLSYRVGVSPQPTPSEAGWSVVETDAPLPDSVMEGGVFLLRWTGSEIVRRDQADIDADRAALEDEAIRDAFDPVDDSGPRGRWRWLAFQLARRVVRLENAAQRAGITFQQQDDTLTQELFKRYVERQGQ